MSQQVRTRFAPSPTGYLHIGGLRTALYCYLFTRKVGGAFLLRIEDTDRKRYVPEAEDYFIRALEWCGIQCDEGVHVGGDYGPYRQSDRKELYQKYVQQLVDTEKAYYAFDTPEELEAMREAAKQQGNHNIKYDAKTRLQMRNSLTLPEEEVQQLLNDGAPYVIRIKIEPNQEVTVNDLVRGLVTINSNEIDDKVMLKSDGMPTYHLANIVDDHSMKITHVIRGEEWLPSTPLHVLLYRAFGWEDTMPQFAHLPLILKPEGKGKLSKRDGDRLGFPVFPIAWTEEGADQPSKGFREMGFFSEAFVNFLAFLGWNPGTEQEIFTMEELTDAFTIERISKSGAKFDFNKAKWFNEQYLKNKSDAELTEAALAYAPEKLEELQICKEYVNGVWGLMKERVTFPSDIWTKAAYLFAKPDTYDAKVVRKKWKEERIPLFEDLKKRLAALDDFSSTNVETSIKAFIEETGLGFGNVLQVFRVMLAGTTKGPSVFDMAALLGKEEVVERMERGAKIFDEMNALLA